MLWCAKITVCIPKITRSMIAQRSASTSSSNRANKHLKFWIGWRNTQSVGLGHSIKSRASCHGQILKSWDLTKRVRFCELFLEGNPTLSETMPFLHPFPFVPPTRQDYSCLQKNCGYSLPAMVSQIWGRWLCVRRLKGAVKRIH